MNPNLREEYGVCTGMQNRQTPSVTKGGEKYGATPEVCLNFLRQLTIVYHFIHYRLDRPYLEDREWPDYMVVLKQELERSLLEEQVPEGWLQSLMLFRTDEKEVARLKRYDFSREPLFAAAKQNIKEILNRIMEIETNLLQFERQKEKNQFIKHELRKISNWALGKAWEVTGILGWENL